MITIFFPHNVPISQKVYDELLDLLELKSLYCTCGHTDCLIKHGYYPRSIKVSSEKIILTILRVRCGICGRTHAILISSIVPYSQILLREQIEIIQNAEAHISQAHVMNINSSIDENNISSILRQYRKYWRQFLVINNISLTDQLTQLCFQHFKKQFMQIKNTPNLLFFIPT